MTSQNPIVRPDRDPEGDFDALYARYFPFVWRCLKSLGVPHSSLDDLSQDVFLIVHRRLSDFQGKSSVRTWLYGILRNVASNHHRGSRRKPLHESSAVAELSSDGPGPLERAQRSEAGRFVQRYASGLNEKKRDVFILALLEGLTVPEVAATLDIPINTAYTRLRAVRADFERALTRHQRTS